MSGVPPVFIPRSQQYDPEGVERALESIGRAHDLSPAFILHMLGIRPMADPNPMPKFRLWSWRRS